MEQVSVRLDDTMSASKVLRQCTKISSHFISRSVVWPSQLTCRVSGFNPQRSFAPDRNWHVATPRKRQIRANSGHFLHKQLCCKRHHFRRVCWGCAAHQVDSGGFIALWRITSIRLRAVKVMPRNGGVNIFRVIAVVCSEVQINSSD